MPAPYDELFRANKALWDERTRHHVASPFYDVEGFLQGRSSLSAMETALLGPVAGKHVLHLQCHFGLDTLSLAREGALATGLDLSGEAIAQACKLAERSGIRAEFMEGNAVEHHAELDGRFDVVFTSFGVLGWLPVLDAWARNIARYLKPGGRLVLVEFHPVVWMFDNDFIQVRYPYFNTGLITEVQTGSYAAPDAAFALEEHTWNHPLDEVLTAILDAGLQLRQFREYDGSPHDCFARTVKGADGLYRIAGMEGKLPMVYGLEAALPGAL